MNSKNLTPTPQQSLPEQWKARQQETLSLSKAIVAGNAGLVSIEMNVTIADTLTKATIRSAYKGNDKLAYSVVSVLVNRFLNSFAFTTKLDKSQVAVVTLDTLEHFAYDSLEDIILFFKMARSGKFGVAKKSVDSNMIFGEWLPKYLEQKAQAREEAYTVSKTNHTAIVTTIEDVKKSYDKVTARKDAEKRQAYVNKLTKDMDRQMLEDTIESWSRDERMSRWVYMLKAKRREIR